MGHANPNERAYHHGDLTRAILDAAEARLRRDGPDGVTLRGCARDAGVSPAAPVHHFGGLKGLLSALAAQGFDRLVARLDMDLATRPDLTATQALIGAYVGHALDNPGLFDLMWQDDRLDPADPVLVAARGRALERLRRLSAWPGDPQVGRLRAMRAWALAHGLAGLARTGRAGAVLGDPGAAPVSEADILALAYSVDFAGD